MKNCTECKYAEWVRTSSGRLHPSGDGMCKYPYKIPAPPASMYFIAAPTICGGAINRRRELSEDCAYFQRGEGE